MPPQQPQNLLPLRSIYRPKNKLLLIAALLFASTAPCHARDFYVSPSGDNTTGHSWATALRTIPPLSFGISPVQPGDKVIIDGGTSGITYTQSLDIGVSGTATSPIVIRQSNQAGHNGPVTLSGGPPGPFRQPVGARLSGNYVQLYGSARGGLKFTNYQFQGIVVNGSNNRLQNIEIANIWGPPVNPGHIPGQGLVFGGTNNTYYSLDVFNCNNLVQQGFSSGPSVHRFSHCWIFDTYNRTGKGLMLQLNRDDSSVLVANCAFGPGLSQSLVNNSTAGQLNVNNTLFLNAGTDNLALAEGVGTSKSHFKNITSFMTPTNSQGATHNNVNYNSAGKLSARDSIFYGGFIKADSTARAAASGNFQYNVLGNTVLLAPTLQDPMFRDAAQINALTGSTTLKVQASTDFSLAAGSQATGKGSAVTSIGLLNKNFANYFFP
ncbi:MAG: hypothetical protein IPP97_20855 [Candidatus Obscuribacter sp.]|nr:hypothetical protein [Candidatus Obscuribacter sp.]